ncbi:MAG TPA: DUF4407 domain-containing protein [Phnomibacter sp.]|nr:DUF4407 domain-containing protein [Phnomibacter sp.]
MNNFLKKASHITGAEYTRLQQSTPYSRLKVKALALAVLIPTLMWTTFGFMLSYAILQQPVWVALGTAAALGFTVFLLERLIVMGNGHWLMAAFRVVLGATVAWLGAQLIDLVIFKTDIDNKLPAVKHAQAMQAMQDQQQQYDEQYGITDLQNRVNAIDALWQRQQQDAVDEAAGLRGTRIKGVADATKFKQQVADKTFAQKQALQDQLDASLTARALKESKAYDDAYGNISDQSILLRIKAMEMLLQNGSAMRHIYWGFTLFMFLLEFLVIIFKQTMKPSSYEEEVAAIEKISKQRLERMYGATSPLLQPHTIHPALRANSQSLASSLNTLL